MMNSELGSFLSVWWGDPHREESVGGVDSGWPEEFRRLGALLSQWAVDGDSVWPLTRGNLHLFDPAAWAKPNRVGLTAIAQHGYADCQWAIDRDDPGTGVYFNPDDADDSGSLFRGFEQHSASLEVFLTYVVAGEILGQFEQREVAAAGWARVNWDSFTVVAVSERDRMSYATFGDTILVERYEQWRGPKPTDTTPVFRFACRDQQAIDRLSELAESVQARVLDVGFMPRARPGHVGAPRFDLTFDEPAGEVTVSRDNPQRSVTMSLDRPFGEWFDEMTTFKAQSEAIEARKRNYCTDITVGPRDAQGRPPGGIWSLPLDYFVTIFKQLATAENIDADLQVELVDGLDEWADWMIEYEAIQAAKPPPTQGAEIVFIPEVTKPIPRWKVHRSDANQTITVRRKHPTLEFTTETTQAYISWREALDPFKDQQSALEAAKRNDATFVFLEPSSLYPIGENGWRIPLDFFVETVRGILDNATDIDQSLKDAFLEDFDHYVAEFANRDNET